MYCLDKLFRVSSHGTSWAIDIPAFYVHFINYANKMLKETSLMEKIKRRMISLSTDSSAVFINHVTIPPITNAL